MDSKTKRKLTGKERKLRANMLSHLYECCGSETLFEDTDLLSMCDVDIKKEENRERESDKERDSDREKGRGSEREREKERSALEDFVRSGGGGKSVVLLLGGISQNKSTASALERLVGQLLEEEREKREEKKDGEDEDREERDEREDRDERKERESKAEPPFLTLTVPRRPFCVVEVPLSLALPLGARLHWNILPSLSSSSLFVSFFRHPDLLLSSLIPSIEVHTVSETALDGVPIRDLFGISGLLLVPNFISQQEEEEICKELELITWQKYKNRQVLHFGMCVLSLSLSLSL